MNAFDIQNTNTFHWTVLWVNLIVLCDGVMYADRFIYNVWRLHIMHSLERRMYKYLGDIFKSWHHHKHYSCLQREKSACMFLYMICLINRCNQTSLKDRGNLLVMQPGQNDVVALSFSESPKFLHSYEPLSMYPSVPRWSSASPREGFWSAPGFVPRRSTTWCWAAGRGSPNSG